MDSKIAHNIEEKERTKDIEIDESVTFDEMFLSDPVLKGLHSCGYVRPSPIQLSAIPLGRCGLDLIIQAKSGTGKTCVFTVIALEMISVKAKTTQVLVVAPTREIAVQIGQVINSVGSSLPDLKAYTFIGGISLIEDKAKLNCCHIAIGTPGRLNQLVSLGHLNLNNIRLLIFDEADQLLTGQFKTSILELVKTSPFNKQILASSATYPKEVTDFLDQFMRSPSHVRLGKESPSLIGINQFVMLLSDHPLSHARHKMKFQELLSILSLISFNQCLIFSNSQLRAESICNHLKSAGWPATFLTGGQLQKDRLQSYFDLCSYKCRILVSTDLSARGLDSEHANLIINMDIPIDQATYLHRIGRAGRFGSFGVAISLACEGEEWDAIKAVVNKTNTIIRILPEKFDTNTVQKNFESLEIIEPLDEEKYSQFLEKLNEKKLKFKEAKKYTSMNDYTIEKNKDILLEKENKKKSKRQKRKEETLDSGSQTIKKVSEKDVCMRTFNSLMNDYGREANIISCSSREVLNPLSKDMKLSKLDIPKFSPRSLVKEYPSKSMFNTLDQYIIQREKNNEFSLPKLKDGSFDKIQALENVIDGTQPLHNDNISNSTSLQENFLEMTNDVQHLSLNKDQYIEERNVDENLKQKKDSETDDTNMSIFSTNSKSVSDSDTRPSVAFKRKPKNKQKNYCKNTGYGEWEPVIDKQYKNNNSKSYCSSEENNQYIENENNDSSGMDNYYYQNRSFMNNYNNNYNISYVSNPPIDAYIRSAQKFAEMMEYTKSVGRMSAWIAQDNHNKLIYHMENKKK